MAIAEKYLPYYTVEDWKNWEGDWQLIEGIPYALASPSVLHQKILKNLLIEISKELEDCKTCEVLPDIDYYISEDTVVRPDILVICNKDLDDKITLTPDIIFEIVSPSSIKMDERIKFELYEKERVKYYVLVYPTKDRKHIKIYMLENNKYKKVFETINENFNFHLKNGDLNINFSRIWK